MADTPKRIQLSRAKGWRMPPGTVKVDRSTGYGNPFVVGQVAMSWPARGVAPKDAAEAVHFFRAGVVRILAKDDAALDALLNLRGKNLACWCALDVPCHADVLLELANLPICEAVP